MDEWIDVKDSLPAPGLSVLAILSTRWRNSQHYTVYRTEPMVGDKGWTWRDSHTGRQEMWFTHWMPLPAAPTEASK